MNDDYTTLVPPAAKLLGRYGIEAGFIIATETAMAKSIIDATWPLREYLARTGFHDYRQQPKGTLAKRIVPIQIIQESGMTEGKMSLYRPETKDGDPRLWIYDFPRYANAGDLIALTVQGSHLYAINCTRVNLSDQLANPKTFLSLLAKQLDVHAATASHLLAKLKTIGAMGFIPTMRPGDTGIGYTLETLLGIAANSSSCPDFHGIELKSGRMGLLKKTATGRHVTLFAKTPEWDLGLYSARQALERFGYRDAKTARLQLFCSVDAKITNTLGFKLDARSDDDRLVNVNTRFNAKGEDVFLWVLGTLRSSFAAKHRETFWVGADSKKVGATEHFHFVQARHTRNPPISTFERLLANGGICVDLTMSEKGKAAVRDHGYLFRVYGSCFDELFPEVSTYSLK